MRGEVVCVCVGRGGGGGTGVVGVHTAHRMRPGRGSRHPLQPRGSPSTLARGGGEACRTSPVSLMAARSPSMHTPLAWLGD